MADSTRPIDPDVIRLQSLIFAHRLKLGEVLNRANVRRSTWWRWTQGSVPLISRVRSVEAAIHAKIAEKEPPNGGQGRIETP